MAKTGRSSDQFVLRLPEGMRERIKHAAEEHGRSMNSEIITALEEWLDEFDWREIQEEDARLSPLEGPKPGDIIDDGIVADEPHFGFVNTPEDVERVVERYTQDSAKRLRKEMLELLNRQADPDSGEQK